MSFRQKLFAILVTFSLAFPHLAFAATASSSASSAQELINQYQTKINELQGTEDTLSRQLSLLDTQISVAQLRVESIKTAITKLGSEITELAGEIDRLDGVLTRRSELVLKRIPESYKRKQTPYIEALFLSKDFPDFLQRVKYISVVEQEDVQLLVQLKATQNNFAERKDLRESKKTQQEQLQAQLQTESKQLEGQKKQKQVLLAETQGSEAVYQKLLAQAKAQLAGFDSFVSSQGGSSLLPNQTFCNDWGCYYNQRDSQWGGIPLNRTKYTLASDGCLVTSVAMVLTHYGKKVNPVDINSNPANFASYYPAYLLYSVSVNGFSADRVNTAIDAALSHQDPVIVGVRAYGGTHFVVLTGGSSGNYLMYDPYIANGHGISFTAHYSVKSIFEINKVVLRG